MSQERCPRCRCRHSLTLIELGVCPKRHSSQPLAPALSRYGSRKRFGYQDAHLRVKETESEMQEKLNG